MANKHKKHQKNGIRSENDAGYEPTNPPRDSDRIPSDQNEESLEIDVENLDEDELRREISQYSDDPDVIDDFAERQELNTGGESLLDTLEEHTMESPRDSAGDVDAEWDESLSTGDETLGGDSPTPDQDVVDDLGDAAGISYSPEEPLNADKINDRDRDRWELNPASANEQDLAVHDDIDLVEDQDDVLEEEEDQPDKEDDCPDES